MSEPTLTKLPWHHMVHDDKTCTVVCEQCGGEATASSETKALQGLLDHLRDKHAATREQEAMIKMQINAVGE